MSSNQFIGGICCYILGCFLASAGGIGGGGVLVSIGLVVFDWGYTRSVVLALVVLFGNFRCFPNKRTKKRKNEQKNRAKQRKKQKQTETNMNFTEKVLFCLFFLCRKHQKS